MTAPIRRARRYVLALTFLVLLASPALSGVPVNSIFEIFTRTSTGEFTRVAIGVQVKPGIVVTVRDERRAGTGIFVRGNFSNRYLAASSIETGHPSDLDVYSVEGSGTSTLRLKSAAAVTTGDAVYLLSVAGGGQPGVVRSIQDEVFAIALPQPAFFPLPGAPVMLDDGTLVGLATTIMVRENEYLVVPVSRITARLAGLPETGPSIASVGATPALRAEGPRESSASMSESEPRAPSEPRPPNDGPGSVDGPSGDGSGPPVNWLDRKARIRKTPPPAYTDEARARRIQGIVVVRVVLGADGTVKVATVVRGLGYGLDEKAIDVAMKTVFEPALDRRGEPVDSTLTISVNFTLR